MAKCMWCKDAKAGKTGYCEECLPIVKEYRRKSLGRIDELLEESKCVPADRQPAKEAQKIIADLYNKNLPFDEKKAKGQLKHIFANCGVSPMAAKVGFWGKLSLNRQQRLKLAKCCPRCNSRNVTFTVQQNSATTRTKRPGALWKPGRAAMNVATLGLWSVVGKRKETSYTSFSNQTVAICQDCGKKWYA